MNSHQTVLDDIDPEIADRMTATRRDLFGKVALGLGGLATVPVVLGVAANQAFAAGVPQQVVDVLNFALTLEYLEDAFYRSGVDAKGLIPEDEKKVFFQIGKHEAAHVAFLQGALGAAAVKKPKFDFTAGGKYGDVFENYDTFKTLSQTFEDLGVAAYKGQAGNLIGSGKVLTAALQIHSVEARHAAEVRKLLGKAPWDGAFDEPKSKDEVLAAATPFIASA